jgi:hypothetical protein
VAFKSDLLRVERIQVSVYCELVADAAHGMYTYLAHSHALLVGQHLMNGVVSACQST